MFKGSVKEAALVPLFMLSLSQAGKRKREKITSAGREGSQNPDRVVSCSTTAVGTAVVFLPFCHWKGSSRTKRDVNIWHKDMVCIAVS